MKSVAIVVVVYHNANNPKGIMLTSRDCVLPDNEELAFNELQSTFEALKKSLSDFVIVDKLYHVLPKHYLEAITK